LVGLNTGGTPGLDLLGIKSLASAVGTEFTGVEVGRLDDDRELLGAVARVWRRP